MFTRHSVIIRFILYTVAIAGVAASLPWLAITYGLDTFFTERGPVEWTQFGLLVTVTLVFLSVVVQVPRWRELAVILACVSAFAAIREPDAFLDHLVPVVGWKIGGVALIFGGIYAKLNFATLMEQVSHFVETRSFVLLWAGFIVTALIAQMLGHGGLFETMMGDDYRRLYKRVIEESGELIGYIIFLAGAIEFRVLSRQCGDTRSA